MLARVHIVLPYVLLIPENENYKVYAYEVDGYQVRIYMPERSERADSYDDAETKLINGAKAFNADVLRIDFQKEEFNRNEEEIKENDLLSTDPPIELIKNVANEFLNRLRYVTNGSRIKLLDSPIPNWNIQYLNDDGTELDEEKGFVRGRFCRNFNFSYIAVNNEVWENAHSIKPSSPLPVWKNLLLDAEALLPEVGPTIILTFTSLEVFISTTLDSLVETGKVDKELWDWINSRGPLKDPSITEKYDFLLKHILGVILKGNNPTWDAFKHLQKARNSFAHEGIAKIGDDIVTSDKAREFIIKAKEIIETIREALPEEHKWPEFKPEIEVVLTQALVKNENNES